MTPEGLKAGRELIAVFRAAHPSMPLTTLLVINGFEGALDEIEQMTARFDGVRKVVVADAPYNPGGDYHDDAVPAYREKILEVIDSGASVEKPINQCDGCRAGKPIDANGNHRMGEKRTEGYQDMMRCQANMYASPSKKEEEESPLSRLKKVAVVDPIAAASLALYRDGQVNLQDALIRCVECMAESLAHTGMLRRKNLEMGLASFSVQSARPPVLSDGVQVVVAAAREHNRCRKEVEDLIRKGDTVGTWRASEAANVSERQLCEAVDKLGPVEK